MSVAHAFVELGNMWKLLYTPCIEMKKDSTQIT